MFEHMACLPIDVDMKKMTPSELAKKSFSCDLNKKMKRK